MVRQFSEDNHVLAATRHSQHSWLFGDVKYMGMLIVPRDGTFLVSTSMPTCNPKPPIGVVSRETL